ncbi:hypothetical protein A9995_00690 [Erythrobacter sp. QSSC1-22B]|uniref:hypothetical protein n=1 Tax=Erythrobacter sp. QSSC1-22B TaxID=1860125 RepID=UPI0008052BA6|nr:hypothetical protein [Erythrobacter sp. QSSC1-22B]OBX20283.1 hypothetical protein A9995_00690 [Erythrobacter sp. QSSC1-22B]
MATDTLQSTTAPAKPAREAYELATDLQTCCSRVRSLAECIGATADDAFSETQERARGRKIQNIINLSDLIEREIAEVTKMGERIEVISQAERDDR